MVSLDQSKSHGCGTVKRKSKLRDSVLVRARLVGIAGDVESMQMALAACVGVYDQILATVPSAVRPVVEGAGGKAMKVARDILDAV